MIGIKVKDLYKRFGDQVVLDGISLQIEAGEILAIVGPSGTGKSVLLKLLTGLLSPESGDVYIGNDCLTATRSERERMRISGQIGVLFQSAALFDSLSLIDNVAFPLRMRHKLSDREIISKAAESLEQVGLSGFELSLPGEVSIGMRKRVGIARALITQPDIVLFDEPNTGLDPLVGQEIYDLIKETHERYQFTGLVISHEIPEVFQICSRVVMLYGKKVQVDSSVEEFFASSNPVVKQFIVGSVDGPIQMAV